MENNQDDPHVLIARNNETGQIGTVTGQNPDGSPKMADVKSAPLSDLVKFSKNQNPLEAFLTNFIRQAKNPSTFRLFKVKADNYETEGRALASLLVTPDTNKEMLAPYAVKTDGMKLTTAEATEASDSQAQNTRHHKVDPDSVDWTRIEKEWGVTRHDLEEQKQLNDMLYNQKSPGLVKLTTTIDGEKQKLEARLSFKHNDDGSITLSPHIKRTEPQLEKSYQGYSFTDADKAELLKEGAISHTVELVNPKTGEKEPSIVHLDKLTNEILSIPVKDVYIKSKICNIDLDMREIMQLKNGGTLRNRDIVTKDGRRFKADIRYSIDRRGLGLINMTSLKQKESVSNTGTTATSSSEDVAKKRVFSFTDADGNPKRLRQWYRIPLDEQKQDAYLAGNNVEAGILNVAGKDYMVYLQFNKEKKMPESSFGIIENGRVVGFGDANKVQAAINLQGKTNEATKKVTDKLDMGQTEPKNPRQKTRQEKGPKESTAKKTGPKL